MAYNGFSVEAKLGKHKPKCANDFKRRDLSFGVLAQKLPTQQNLPKHAERPSTQSLTSLFQPVWVGAALNRNGLFSVTLPFDLCEHMYVYVEKFKIYRKMTSTIKHPHG